MDRIKKLCKPTTILMIVGFSISFASVLIGISSINSVMVSLSDMDTDSVPVYSVMENTGMSLALELYIFSIANCLVITNYWVITKHREMAIRKAFGWSNQQLMFLVISEMNKTLCVSMLLSALLLTIIEIFGANLFSLHLTPFFILSLAAMLVLTLLIASIIPILRILKIKPAEVIA